jgi:hypothetical protein
MDWLKWCTIIAVPLQLLLLASVVLYLFTPLIISAVTGAPASCDYGAGTVPGGAASIGNALAGLCITTRSFLGMATMLLAVLSIPFTLAACLLASIEVATAPSISINFKLLWLVAFWLFLGAFGVALYYFTTRKVIKGA